MVRNQDIAVINRHIPFYCVALEIAEPAVSNLRIHHLIMAPLAQNGIVSMCDGEFGYGQITPGLFIFPTDEYLGNRTETTHRQPFNYTVRTPDVQGNIGQLPPLLPSYLATVLQNESPFAVTSYFS
ncbi:hypothetical protein ESCOCK386M_09415 [Escherichia coli]